TAGEYVVTFYGADAVGGDDSIYVQKFNADGTVAGAMVQLESTGGAINSDQAPQITAVGTAGEYVVTFEGYDVTDYQTIFVQKFNVDGTTTGNTMIQLDGNPSSPYGSTPQVTTVGTSGEYVVTFFGVSSSGYYSIFVQKFNANGTVQGAMVQLDALNQAYGYDYYP
ncbi:hypothetical protein JZU71_04645, partial [bacterium]|nr:hypothetical protein [bacterium]